MSLEFYSSGKENGCKAPDFPETYNINNQGKWSSNTTSRALEFSEVLPRVHMQLCLTGSPNVRLSLGMSLDSHLIPMVFFLYLYNLDVWDFFLDFICIYFNLHFYDALLLAALQFFLMRIIYSL